jgi:hypothetical protein
MTNHRTLSTRLTDSVQHLSDEILVVALEAFREGRHAGAARLGEELAAYLDQLHAELEAGYEKVSPESVANVEASYVSARPSPVFAAHFGGAGDVLERVRVHLRKLASKRRG